MEYLILGCGAIYIAKRKKLIFKNSISSLNRLIEKFPILSIKSF